jgi:hypothetical protein
MTHPRGVTTMTTIRPTPIGTIAGSYDYTRAVQTAEAFITLFTKLDANFDEAVFLRECGFALPLPKDGAE